MSRDPLADFVQRLEEIVSRGTADEPALLSQVGQAMATLVAADEWLPEPFARPDAAQYRQYLLHADAAERFSVVSFVWGPGQCTPIHDHGTWGVVGMLRGAEVSTSFTQAASGMKEEMEFALNPGDVMLLSPAAGDIHRVRNAYTDRVSISIHAYGANIGKQTRHVFDPGSGERKAFVSGYSNAPA